MQCPKIPNGFPRGVDRTLTQITLFRGSFPSDILAIVEPEPYPNISEIGSQWWKDGTLHREGVNWQ